MTIKVGDRVPDGTLTEFIETETAGCSLGPNAFQVADLTRGKTIALFAVPGAFTPTCSAKHLPGYVEQAAALKAKGVDEIWCVSVNDAFVMGAWGREQKTEGKVRMLADGSKEPNRAIVVLSSSNAQLVSVEKGEYCISKCALSMMSKLFALRLARAGISVFEIQPGLIRTDMTAEAARSPSPLSAR